MGGAAGRPHAGVRVPHHFAVQAPIYGAGGVGLHPHLARRTERGKAHPHEQQPFRNYHQARRGHWVIRV